MIQPINGVSKLEQYNINTGETKSIQVKQKRCESAEN
jgi:hypothetical protein